MLYSDVSEQSVCSIYIGAYEDGTECSETSEYNIQTPGNYPGESTQQKPCFQGCKWRLYLIPYKSISFLTNCFTNKYSTLLQSLCI